MEIVLGLSEMESAVPTAALTALCCVSAASKVLVTHEGLATAEQRWHTPRLLSNIHPLTSGLGVGETLGGHTARTAGPN